MKTQPGSSSTSTRSATGAERSPAAGVARAVRESGPQDGARTNDLVGDVRPTNRTLACETRMLNDPLERLLEARKATPAEEERTR